MGDNDGVRTALALLGIVVVAGTWSCSEPCSQGVPTVEGEVRILSADMRIRARSLYVEVRYEEEGFSSTYELPSPAPVTTTFGVELDPPPEDDGYLLEVVVVAYGEAEGRGTRLDERRVVITGQANACNRVVVELGQSDGPDAGRDGGMVDGGPEVDGGLPPSSFSVEPVRFDAPWTDRGAVVTFDATVVVAPGLDPTDVTATASAADSWVEVSPVAAADASTGVVTVTINTDSLAPGAHSDAIRFAAGTTEVRVPVTVRVFAPVYIGPEPGSCPHDVPGGGTSDGCDFTGATALVDATLVPRSFVHLILYDAGDAPFIYFSKFEGIPLMADSWMSSAAEADPRDVIFRCWNGRGLVLQGNRVRLERFSAYSAGSCDQVISTWATRVAEDGTSDHEIDRMIIAAFRPEAYGANSIQAALALSANTKLTNCHVYGYWEGLGDLSRANNTEIIGNTFIFYQNFPNAILAGGVIGLKVVNNVFIALPDADAPLVQANGQTTGLVVAGNALEGFPMPVVAGANPLDTTNRVEDNTFGPVPVESPHNPVFRSDSTATVSGLAPSVSVSLDGVVVDGQTPGYPGAFQRATGKPGLRPAVLRLGPSDCVSCDLTTDVDNEVQVAAWSLWPGGVLEIDPGQYAGPVVLTWPISIRGLGATAEDVVITGREENIVWRESQVWTSHQSIVAVTRDARAPLTLENFTINMPPSGVADEFALFAEGTDLGDPPDRHTIRQVIMRATAAGGAGLRSATRLGNSVLLQDVLIHGEWASCGRIAYQTPHQSAPAQVRAILANVTCRLTGTGVRAPQMGFEMAAVRDTSFINSVFEIETSTVAPLFSVQRRTMGDDGPIALDPPVSFGVFGVHHRGFAALLGGFNETSGNYELLGAEELQPADPLFVGEMDSRLAVGSPAIDSGVEVVIVGGPLGAGTSVDGVDRTDREVDRGAYEQGQ